jgi:hypothetical protein
MSLAVRWRGAGGRRAGQSQRRRCRRPAPSMSTPRSACPRNCATLSEGQRRFSPTFPIGRRMTMASSAGRIAGRGPSSIQTRSPTGRPQHGPRSLDQSVPERLMGVLRQVIARDGAVRVTSGWRSAARTRRNSWHRRCEEVDFRVPGVHPQTVSSLERPDPYRYWSRPQLVTSWPSGGRRAGAAGTPTIVSRPSA